MATPRKKTTIRIEQKTRLKIGYIADMNGRSMSRHIEHILKQNIQEYEDEHGVILLPTKPNDPEDNY